MLDDLQRLRESGRYKTDPVNIRYATGARSMQVFHSRNPARTLIVPAEGPVTLFEFPGCHHLAAELETIDEIRPGMAFRELAERAWPIPERYVQDRYFVVAHGVGMTGEYPYVCHSIDYVAFGDDGVIEPGMTLCVKSYIGGPGGAEGVKLEEQALVREAGVELLSHYPLDDALTGREC